MTVDIYLWSIDADIDHSTLGGYASSLSADEQSRADRYRFAGDRRQFVLARGFLRTVLALHLGIKATDIDLVAQPGKKPYVTQPDTNNRIRFSLTHSSGMIMVGVGSERDIGIDIESKRRRIDIATLATSVFSPPELHQWQTMDAESRIEQFYTAWTRKEALGKAMGTGISNGPDTIQVPLEPVRNRQWLPAGNSLWLMSELPVPDDHYGSLIIERLGNERFEDDYRDRWVNHDDAVSFAGNKLTPLAQSRLIIRQFQLSD